MPAGSFDAIVIGSGPNGLAAAITLARAGCSVLVREGAATLGGSARSAALTLEGFTHDICSTVHALALVSPFFRTLPLDRLGVEFVHPQAAFAHPLDDGTAAVAEYSLDATADGLGRDGEPYRRLFGSLIEAWPQLAADILGPIRIPHHPVILARFGLNAIRSARGLARATFATERARALLAGAAAHSVLPLNWAASSAFGLVLTLCAHGGGWPVIRGGSQRLIDGMASYLKSLGGQIEVSAPVQRLEELPPARAILCDVTPRQLLGIAGHLLSAGYRCRLERYRYGPGAYKIDWALDGPIPWQAAACARAATVHLGGSLDEIAASEVAPWKGVCAEKPFVLLVQPSLFDATRAPPGQHTAWAYCHVPHGSTEDMTGRIEAQVERFAPGFRSRILARSVMNTRALELYNPNLVGGDINGGAQDLGQLFTRPIASLNPYATSIPGLYLCSSSTPPGGGVHGMCGHFAAKAALRYLG